MPICDHCEAGSLLQPIKGLAAEQHAELRSVLLLIGGGVEWRVGNHEFLAMTSSAVTVRLNCGMGRGPSTRSND